MYFGSLYCKSYGPRSDCSLRSSLILVHSVCFHSKCVLEIISIYATDVVSRELFQDKKILAGSFIMTTICHNDSFHTYSSRLGLFRQCICTGSSELTYAINTKISCAGSNILKLVVIMFWLDVIFSNFSVISLWLFFVCFDSLHPRKQFFSHVGMCLPGLNQY